MGSRKAPRMGIKDALERVTVDAVEDDQLAAPTVAYLKEVDLQGMPVAGDSGSLHGEESAQVEEELSLVSIGVLPPRYKELISASIHLAPHTFTRV